MVQLIKNPSGRILGVVQRLLTATEVPWRQEEQLILSALDDVRNFARPIPDSSKRGHARPNPHADLLERAASKLEEMLRAMAERDNHRAATLGQEAVDILKDP